MSGSSTRSQFAIANSATACMAATAASISAGSRPRHPPRVGAQRSLDNARRISEFGCRKQHGDGVGREFDENPTRPHCQQQSELGVAVQSDDQLGKDAGLETLNEHSLADGQQPARRIANLFRPAEPKPNRVPFGLVGNTERLHNYRIAQ